MTVFLTPDGEPFFGGTYYPPEPRHGLPSFRQLLVAIADAYRDRREDVAQQAAAIVDALRRSAELMPSREPLSGELIADAVRVLRGQLDPEWGGFGRAPKFPPASTIELLLRARRARRGDEDARRHGGRRDVRPRRRRLPPLLRRRPLARAALREDALRQRAARSRVPARVGGDGERAVSQGRRGDARLHGARAAAAERRLRLVAGRRHRRRRGAHVHVDGGRGRAAGAARAVRARPLHPPRRAGRRDARAPALHPRPPSAAARSTTR